MEADEKICPRCAETVKLAAKVCKHCGYEFTAADQPIPSPAPPPPPAPSPIQINPMPQPMPSPRPYSPPPRPEVMGDPPAKGRTLMIVLASIVGVIVVLALIGMMAEPETPNGAAPQAAGTGAPAASGNAGSGDETAAPADNGGSSEQADTTAVSSVELARAYNANEVSAQSTYGNKTLDVTGTITGVKLDLFNNPVVEMQGVNEFLPVQATFDQRDSQKISALSKGQEITVRCTSITEVISAPMLSECSLPQ